METHLRTLRRADLSQAVGVAARAFADNPINVAVYGPDHDRRIRRNEAALRAFLPTLACPLLGAYQGQTLVGVVGVAPPGTASAR